MGVYREHIETVFILAMDAEVFGSKANLQSALQQEHFVRNGIFWALKWATKFCPESGRGRRIKPRNVKEALEIGQNYDVLVDVLRHAENNLIEISVNQESRRIIAYEGKDLTGFDAEIVEHQQGFGPTRAQAFLTDDSDQLTSNWRAGDYRRVIRQLADFASTQEDLFVLNPDYSTTLDKGENSIPRPTIVWLEQPTKEPDSHVFDSLTMPSKMSGAFMWKARSLLETPIVRCGKRFCALSSDLKAISCIDDYMLRLAAREDEKQYNRVSGLRERRMIDFCGSAFETCNGGWTVRSSVKLTDPPQEADIVASRLGEALVIELKSTLRPESLWEVYKRNQDILKGLRQAESLVRRGVGNRSLVITDGYWGDYVCWEEARKRDVIIGTLDEVAGLTRDQERATRLMKTKAGIPTRECSGRRLSNREFVVVGWTLRLIDGEPE